MSGKKCLPILLTQNQTLMKTDQFLLFSKSLWFTSVPLEMKVIVVVSENPQHMYTSYHAKYVLEVYSLYYVINMICYFMYLMQNTSDWLSILVDTRVLHSEETEDNKKSFKIVMFDSQEFRVNRSHGLKKRKKEHSRI